MPTPLTPRNLLEADGVGAPDGMSLPDKRVWLGERLLPALLGLAPCAIVLDFGFGVGGPTPDIRLDQDLDRLGPALLRARRQGVPVIGRIEQEASAIPVCSDWRLRVDGEGCLAALFAPSAALETDAGLSVADIVAAPPLASPTACTPGLDPTLSQALSRLLRDGSRRTDMETSKGADSAPSDGSAVEGV